MRRFLAVVVAIVLAVLIASWWSRTDVASTSHVERFVPSAPRAAPLVDEDVVQRAPPRDEARAPEIVREPAIAAPSVESIAGSPERANANCTVTFALVYDDARAAASTSAPLVSCRTEDAHVVETFQLGTHGFEATRVPVGRHRVEAFVREHAPLHLAFEVAEGERAKTVELRFEPLSAGSQREVLVRWQTEDGQPFVPALATAWTAGRRGVLGIRTPAGGGRFGGVPRASSAHRASDAIARVRPGAPADSYALLAVRPEDVIGFEARLDGRVLTTFDVPASADEVVIRTSVAAVLAELASVRGVAVGADDRVPVPAVRAWFDVGTHVPLAARAGNSPGSFALDGLAAGRARLVVEAAGARVERDIEIEPGRALDLGEIPIPSGCPFRVRIADEHGEPATHALVLCAPRAQFTGPVPQRFALARMSAGVADVDVAPAEEAVLVVSVGSYGLAALAVGPCGRRGDDHELRIVPGRRVVLDLGLGSADATVRIATADGLPLGDREAESAGLAVVLLAPGDYVARRGTSGKATAFRVGTEPLTVVLD